MSREGGTGTPPAPHEDPAEPSSPTPATDGVEHAGPVMPHARQQGYESPPPDSSAGLPGQPAGVNAVPGDGPLPSGVSGMLARAHPRLIDVLALGAGALQVCAYAPFELPVFAVLAPMLMLLLWRDAGPGRAAWLGLLYGLGLFGLGVHWIYYSLHLFGDAIAPLSALLTGGFVFGVALCLAALGYLLCRRRAADPLWLLVLAPAGWALAEWLRSWVLTGFPWLLLGHSQTDWPLAGYFPLLGVFGVSWLLALTAGSLALVLRAGVRSTPGGGALVLCAALWVGGTALQQVQWAVPVGEPIRVRMVQGNVGQEDKFLAEILQQSIDAYTRMSVAGPAVDLVIWPETAMPTFYDRVADQLRPLAAHLRAAGADLAIGVLEFRHADRRYFNVVRKVTLDAGPAPTYRKHHLVPFGEFMPFRDLLQFIGRYIQIPMSDLEAGEARQAPLPLAGHLAGVSICYEDAFGEEVIAQLPAANYLVNVSNDAWFGDSIAPHQHLQIARVRTLETARAMARSTNTGISAFIDYDGRIIARSPQFEAHALDASIQPRTGATPYVRYGNYPVVAALLLALGIATFGIRSSGKRA